MTTTDDTKIDGDEWRTPLWVLDLARELMGGIDLDPASCAAANERVKAKLFFTKDDNGLVQDWQTVTRYSGGSTGYGPARVLVNPPFSKTHGESHTALFLRKLRAERQKGYVQEALFLTNVATSAKWFRAMWEYPLCFFYERLKFEHPQSTSTANRYEQVIAYVGHRPARFAQLFEPYGHVNPAPAAPKKMVKVTAWVDQEQLTLFDLVRDER